MGKPDIKGLFRTLWKAAVRVWEGDDPVAHPVVQRDRTDICWDCPRYQPSQDLCEECFCIVSIKTKFKDAACPLSKW